MRKKGKEKRGDDVLVTIRHIQISISKNTKSGFIMISFNIFFGIASDNFGVTCAGEQAFECDT